MQLKIINKNIPYVLTTTILFIGCTTFVAYRGYSCFDKYFKKPKNSEVSYESSKNHPFPSFTLCASKNASYNDNQMKKCQLERNEYLDGSKWVGEGGFNCTDPKSLHHQVAADSEDLEIERIWIMTYAFSKNVHNFQPSNFDNLYDYLPQINQNLSIFQYNLALMSQYQRCFSFAISDYIVRQGIKSVVIYSKPFEKLYLHNEGTISAPIPGSSMSAKYADLYRAWVTRESIELLNYDGKNCNNDDDYNYDKCKQDYIYKVYGEMKMVQ